MLKLISNSKRIVMLMLVLVVGISNSILPIKAQSLNSSKTSIKTIQSKQNLDEEIKEILIKSGKELKEAFKSLYNFIKKNNIIEKSVDLTKKAFQFLRKEINELKENSQEKTPTNLNQIIRGFYFA